MFNLSEIINQQPVVQNLMAQVDQEHELMYRVINEGRSARAVGLTLKPPPFRRKDMEDWWRIGWIYEHQDRDRREREADAAARSKMLKMLAP